MRVFNFMPCGELDSGIRGNKEGGTTLLMSVAELASDLPHYSAPKTIRCQ